MCVSLLHEWLISLGTLLERVTVMDIAAFKVIPLALSGLISGSPRSVSETGQEIMMVKKKWTASELCFGYSEVGH